MNVLILFLAVFGLGFLLGLAVPSPMWRLRPRRHWNDAGPEVIPRGEWPLRHPLDLPDDHDPY